MIFGDPARFALKILPVHPTWVRESRNDTGPWATFALYIEGRCLTRNVVQVNGRQELNEGVNVPLLSLAEWFATSQKHLYFEEFPAHFRLDASPHEVLERWKNSAPRGGVTEDFWDDARFDWYRQHFLLAGADGAILPDLAISRAESFTRVSWMTPKKVAGQRVDLLDAGGSATVQWEDCWQALTGFVSYVSEWLREHAPGIESPILNFRFGEPPSCNASQYLQIVNPAAVPIMKRLKLDTAEPLSSITLQILRDVDARKNTAAVDSAIKSASEVRSRPPRARQLQEWRSDLSTGESARVEDAGYEAADWLRGRDKLNGQAISDDSLRATLESISEVEEVSLESNDNDAFLGCGPSGDAKVVIVRHTRTQLPWARRMEMARAIGHLLLDAPTARGIMGAASSRQSVGVRRKRSGAFAAEFLMPITGIHRVLGQGGDVFKVFPALLHEFGVGARTAANHLWNRGFLDSSEIRDGLIEEFASEKH